MAARTAVAAGRRSASLISHLRGRGAVGLLASPTTHAPLSVAPIAAGVVGAPPGSRRFLETLSRTVPVSPGGSLRLRIRQACRLRVEVADVHTSPWDQAVVSLDVSATPPGGRADDGGGGRAAPRVMSADAAAAVSDDFGVRVYCDSERNTVTVDSEAESTPHWLARLAHQVSSWVGGPFRRANPSLDAAVTLTLTIPGKFHVDVELEEGTCTVDGTLEGNFRFVSSSADLVASRLKSGYVDIDAGDGDVSAGVVQGHATLRTGAGNVDVGRLQGPFIGVHTGSGDIQARSVYATYASIRTVGGGVRLGTAAGNLHIRCSGEGEVEMGGVTGALDVETDEGDVEVQLAAPGRVAVASARGDVELAVTGDGAVSGVGVCLEAGGDGGVTLSDSVRLLRVGGESRHSVRGVLQGGPAHPTDGAAMGGAPPPPTPAAGLAAATAAAAEADADSPAKAPHIWVRAAAGDVRLTTREWATSFVGGEGVKPTSSSSTTATAAAAVAPPQVSSPEGTPLWGGRPFPRWAPAYPPPRDDATEGGGARREPAPPAPTSATATAAATAGSGRA